MSETEDEVSHFSVDGVVAEMVIQVEDNQKSGSDDLANSPEKNLISPKKGEDLDKVAKAIHNEKTEIEKPDIVENEDNISKESIEVSEESIEIPEKSIEVPEKNIEIPKKDIKIPKKDTKILKDSDNIVQEDKLKKYKKVGRPRKRKSELTENKNVIDMPRYSGRKRLANKRYISEDMITPKYNKSDPQSKDTPTGVKRRKLESNSKDTKKENFKETKKDVSNNKQPKKSAQSNKESIISENEVNNHNSKNDDASNIEKELVKKDSKIIEGNVEMEEPKDKHKTLRKLPFRKNRDAPDVPDLKPKIFWWNGVGEGEGVKLGDIPEIRERMKKAKSVRALYRVLFFQWPTNGQDISGQILEFNGFPFDKSSFEFTKRQNLMKIMLDPTLSNICDILYLKKGDKQTMINNILNFLLRPYKKIDPFLDPSLQPVVVLERIQLDEFFGQLSGNFKSKSDTSATRNNIPLKRGRKRKIVEEPPEPIVRPTRKSARRISIESSSSKSSAKTKDVSTKSKDSVKTKDISVNKKTVTPDKPALKQQDSTSLKSSAKEKIISVTKETKSKTPHAAKDTKHPDKDKRKIKEKVESLSKSRNENDNKIKNVKDLKKKTKLLKNKKVLKEKSSDSDQKQKSVEETKENDNEIETMSIDSDSDLAENIETAEEGKKYEAPTTATTENSKKPDKESNKRTSDISSITLSDSSETESAEETKLVTAARKPTKPTKPSPRRKGQPLGHFPQISECIKKANFSALQRLHILLFGASDKPDNLKSNILAFGGFPFVEGSDEWKQKHFLLSLLAQNNLREYLNLLCIKYSDDDQPTMINKLMKFLAFPTADSTTENEIQPIETEVVSSVLTNKPVTAPAKGRPEAKKKVKKKEEKKGGGTRNRKVLMSEEEARRLEASFAREQRALAREAKAPPPITGRTSSVSSGLNKPLASAPVTQTKPQPKDTVLHIKPPIADPNQLNALLQTVYKRRALKAAGAVISTPNKGERTKLGDIENIKFLIVTGNLPDLKILHHLIFMCEAAKSRLRKNILEFDGFRFNEDSEKYKERIAFLYSLGYDISKRISFLLGLCTLQTNISQQDLNELIMYFLMSPCKTKQVVPITEMPISGAPGDSYVLKPTYADDKISQYQCVFKPSLKPQSPKSPKVTFQASTPIPKANNQKARKSFHSSLTPKISPVKKVLLPPSNSVVVGAELNKQAIGTKSTVTLLNSAPAVPSYSLAKMTSNMPLLNAPTSVALVNTGKVSNVSSLTKLPLNTGGKVQVMNQPQNVAVLNAVPKIPVSSVSNVGGKIMQNHILIPQLSNKVAIQPKNINIIQAPLLQGSNVLVKNPSTLNPASPQEFLVHQQTPDGQQKTFKLIRLPANHPLASVVNKNSTQQIAIQPQIQQTATRPQVQQTAIQPRVQQIPIPSQVQQQLLLTGSPSTGVILTKNTSGLSQPLQSIQGNLKTVPINISASSSISSSVSITKSDEFILPDKGESAETTANSSSNDDLEIIKPVQENLPTDEELFACIQEIILSSNFEDITLRNVIERVSAQFPLHDLTHRHNYMKECVKKIIIGT